MKLTPDELLNITRLAHAKELAELRLKSYIETRLAYRRLHAPVELDMQTGELKMREGP